jgi:hypothetical protein
MNNLFDIKRLGLVLRKDLKENLTRYLMYFGVLTGVLALLFILNNSTAFSVHTDNYKFTYTPCEVANKSLLVISSILFISCGLVAGSMIMKPMNNKIKRITWLTFPASSLEKFLARLLIVTVGCTVFFIVAMYVADIILMCYWKARFFAFEVKLIDLTGIYGKKTNPDLYDPAFFPALRYFATAIAGFFLVQSIFILGATFWSRNSFPKTFLAVFVILIAYTAVCGGFVNLFYDNHSSGFNNVMNSFFYKGSALNPDGELPLWFFCTLAFFTLFNWVFAYFRFREQELTEKF